MINGIYGNTLTQTNDVTKLLEEQKGLKEKGNGSDIDVIGRQQDVSGEEVDNAIKAIYSSVHYKDYIRYQNIAKIIRRAEAFERDRLYNTLDVITKVEDIVNRKMRKEGVGVTEEFESPKLPKEEMTIDEIQEYIKPQNVSGRIVDFTKDLYEMWKFNPPDVESKGFDKFFNMLKGVIGEGFRQAREILGVLPEDIESMINEIYDLAMQGMDEWYEEIMGRRPEGSEGRDYFAEGVDVGDVIHIVNQETEEEAYFTIDKHGNIHMYDEWEDLAAKGYRFDDVTTFRVNTWDVVHIRGEENRDDYRITVAEGENDWIVEPENEIEGNQGIGSPQDNPVIVVEPGESVTIHGQFIEALNSQIEIIQDDDGSVILNLKEEQSVRINNNLIEATNSDLTIAIGEDGAKLHLLEEQKAGINDWIVHALQGNFILALEEGEVRVDINERYTVKVDEEEVEVIKGRSNLSIFQDGSVSLDISPYSIVALNGQEIKTDDDQITILLLNSLLTQQEEDLVPEVLSTYGKQEANISL